MDYDDNEYVLCSNCDEEYTQDELSDLYENRTYQENVCESCQRAYREKVKELQQEAIEQADELWKDGYINR